MKKIAVITALFILTEIATLPAYASADSANKKTASTTSAGVPIVTNAWARATVPAQKVGAAYMEITSQEPVALLSAETNIATEVQIHTMHTHDGVMKMRKLEKLAIPARTQVALAPGGVHFMLMGLKMPLKVGETFTLKMIYLDQTNRTITSVVQVPVRAIGQ